MTWAAVTWVAALLAGPLISRWSEVLGGALYLAGGLVCHQQAERSFHLAGSQLPVCARCLGFYVGGALGLVTWVAVARRRVDSWPRASALRWLALAGAPTAVSVLSAWTGAGDPANLWRALLALPLGITTGLVVGAVTTEHLK